MTYAPQTLLDLEAYWKANGGTPLGIVGDASHIAIGTSYHLGKDRLLPGAYSVQLPRDKAGLTDAASAIDLGKLNGSYKGLQDFSRWAVARLQADPAARFDVREVIYSPDGVIVQRYSGIDNLIHIGPGNGDASHRFHTHWSFLRDSEFRDKVALFAPYFEEVPPVLDFTWISGQLNSSPGTVTVSIDGAEAILADGSLYPLAKGLTKHSYGLLQFKDGNWKGQIAYMIGEDCGFLLARAATYLAVSDCADDVESAAKIVEQDAAVTATKIRGLA